MTWLTHLAPGILLGVALNRCGLGCMGRVRRMLAFADLRPLRCTLAALGFGMLSASLLMWLAVIDVDAVRVMPMHGGTLIGGLLAGIALGCTGVSPGICLTAAGSGSAVYGLCGILGCIAGSALLRIAGSLLPAVRDLLPASRMTVFATTLDHPFLLDGRFAGLACLGAVLLAASLLLPRKREIPNVPEPEPEIAENAKPPETLREDVFVAILPEEEPIVIDTAADLTEPLPEEEPPEDDEDSIRELMLLDGNEDQL